MGPEGQELREITGPSPDTDNPPAPAGPAVDDRRALVAMFAREAALFAALRPTLLDREGEYVLIKGDELVGIYPTLEAVDEAAVGRFGMAPVFVKKIRRDDSPVIVNIMFD